MMYDDLVLGVDGGGTKTVAWIAPRDRPDETNLVGRGQTGPGNVRVVGLENALENISTAIQLAFEDGQRKRGPVASACLGLAGADREAERLPLTRWAQEQRIAERITVTNDAIPVIYAGFRDGCGIGVISGTGSMVLGRSQAGTVARCGGWGPLFGDEGSGYGLAIAALASVARAADGRGRETALTEGFLQAFDVCSASDLIPAVYSDSVDRAKLAACANIIFSAAADDDAEAQAILNAGSEHLAEMVSIVARKLQFTDQPIPVAVAGGVLLSQDRYRDLFLENLSRKHMQLKAMTLVQDAVAGSLRIAALAE